MNLNPAELLNPIFNALDGLIENDGVYLARENLRHAHRARVRLPRTKPPQV